MNLSYDCLKKMANDPEFAKEIEWNLSGEVAANSMVYGWAQRDGVVLGGRTVTYDANGNRQSSCGGMRTANTGNGNNNTDKIQKKYKEEEERLLKARKKREEKEKFAEKVAEKRAERKAQMERVMREHTEKSAIRREQIEKENAVQTPVGFSTGMDRSASTGFDIKA